MQVLRRAVCGEGSACVRGPNAAGRIGLTAEPAVPYVISAKSVSMNSMNGAG